MLVYHIKFSNLLCLYVVCYLRFFMLVFIFGYVLLSKYSHIICILYLMYLLKCKLSHGISNIKEIPGNTML